MAKKEDADRWAADSNLGVACGSILAAMPGPDDHSLVLSDVADQLFQSGVVPSRASAAIVVNTVVAVFERLGLIFRPHPDLVHPVSDDAATFLHSLGEYLKAGLPLLGDWRARGAMPDSRRHRDLIGILEQYRIDRQGENAPVSRRIEAVAAIVKGRLAGRQVYLLQENPNWQLNWWIGGIVEKADPTPENALYREIEEELGVAPRDVTAMQHFTELTYCRMSARLRAKTEYHTRFYEVTFNEQTVPVERFNETNELTTIDRNGREFVRHNRWLTWEDICAQPGFESKASDIAAVLSQRGIAGLAAHHIVGHSGQPPKLTMLPRGSTGEGNDKVAAMLRDMNRIVLSECVVSGKYLKYDPVVRNSLKDWARRIGDPLRTKTTQEVNFLIWAASGSGKSYFVQQIAEQLKDELGDDFAYVECNLAKDTQSDFTQKVNSVATKTGPVLCLLDEIDTLATEKWPYEVCFAKLELNTNPDKRVVFVLIGSSEANLSDMVTIMENRHKGPDLLNRILQDHNCFTIPKAKLEDITAMVVGQIVNLIGNRVRAVEKLALYYILCNDTLNSSPKQLREFIRSAATRFQDYDERLRFYHLFRPEDEEKRYAFRRANEDLIDELIERDVQIS